MSASPAADRRAAEARTGLVRSGLARGGLPFVVLIAAILLAFRVPFQRLDLLLVGHDMVQSYNWESLNRWALEQGQLPLWNPFIFAGFPALADIQTQVLYPPAMLLRWLPIPAFFTALISAHIFVAGTGTYLLCRILAIGRLASLIAAIGFMLGGVFAPRIDAGHVTMIATWAWFPMGLWLSIKVTRERSLAPVAGLGLVLAFQILSGHPQSTLYTFGATALYFGCAALQSSRSETLPHSPLRILLRGFVAFALAIGLSSVQLVPTAMLVREVSRSEGLDFRSAARNSLGVEHLMTLLFPNSFPSMPPDPNDSVRGKYWEQSSYVGLAITILAPLAILAGKDRWTTGFFVILAVLGLGLAAGENLPLFYIHYWLLPTLRQASRLLPLWSLAAVVLGAMGLDWLCRQSHARSIGARYVYLASLVVLALAVLPLLPDGHLVAGEAYGRSLAFVAIPLLLLAGLAIVGSQDLPKRVILGLLVLTVSVDLVSYASEFIQVSSAPAEKGDRMRIARLFAGAPIGRVVTLCDQDVHVDDMTALRVPTVEGYNSFFFGNYARFGYLVRDNAHESVKVHAPRIWPPSEPPERMDLLRLMNVTHVVGCMPPPLDGYDMVSNRMDRRLYADRTPVDRAVWTCQSQTVATRDDAIRLLQSRDTNPLQTVVIQGEDGMLPAGKPCEGASSVQVIARDRPDGFVQVRVNAAEPGALFLSEPFYAERRAWIDGAEVPIVRANVAFSAIAVGPGEHIVELRLVPTSLYIGAIGTLLTMITMLLGLAWSRRHKREPTPES